MLPRCVARLFLAVLLALPALASAQASFSKEKLDQMLAPIALYPDALLSQVLMASTYPDDVAEAAKWSKANAEERGDAAVQKVADRPWDPSVQSLVAFPQVIITMGDKPDWVREMGDAFLDQPQDVMDSVQRLRVAAQKAGNLKSSEQVTVKVEQPEPAKQVIVIEQPRPEIVYVPSYNPAYVYGPWWYPAYPPYYYPPPPGYWFSVGISTGIAWGVSIGVANAMWGGVNWGRGDVNINVNKFNNINVSSNRLDVNGGKANWRHDPDRRGKTPYRGGDSQRANLTQKRDVARRESYRGRDAGAADRTAARDRAQSVSRDSLPNAGQGGIREGRDRAEPARVAQRETALQGVGDRQAGRQTDRGAASRQSMQSHARPAAGGGARAGGGGGGLRR